MTIPETAARVRVALCYCVNADEGVSSTERRYFHAVQLNSTDEEVISFWLSVSYLDKHHVPMFVAKQWAKQANDLTEWMALLERNTAPPENNCRDAEFQHRPGWRNDPACRIRLRGSPSQDLAT